MNSDNTTNWQVLFLHDLPIGGYFFLSVHRNMPNEYSIEIHNYITAQIDIHEQERAKLDDNGAHDEIRYLQGKLDELHWLRRYLADNVDLKNFKYY